jgi:hypothetical protein
MALARNFEMDSFNGMFAHSVINDKLVLSKPVMDSSKAIDKVSYHN